jgi:hypothetical protein
MKRKLFTTSCLASTALIAAIALANAAPNPSESGPSMTPTPTTSTTTAPPNAPMYPSHGGYGY